MDKVFTSLAVSVDGFITGRGPGPGHGLGDGGILFGWYGDGDTPSQLFPSFRLFEPSAPFSTTSRGGSAPSSRAETPATTPMASEGRARTRRLRSSWSAIARRHPR
jgi:hypothetical protein